MKIVLVTPAPRGSRAGNRITARRWAAILRGLGHEVKVVGEYLGGSADLLVALHARKSHASVRRFAEKCPSGKRIVALTGTDLYVDLGRSREAAESLELAHRVIVLQPLAREELAPDVRAKTRVIYQSARVKRAPPRRRGFEVCVVGHLRPVKDPFRIALASRQLPAESRIVITHIGRALSPEMERRARSEMARNPRYRWTSERPRAETLRRLARANLVVLTSRSEGGANVISEALVAGVPVLASRIPGSIGLLGRHYPGFFPFGDTRALAHLLERAERDPEFLARLRAAGARKASLFEPARERDNWRRLLAELHRKKGR